MKTTAPTKAEKAEWLARRRAAHHKALESLATNGKPGLTLWRALRRLESITHAATTAQCNGASYGGQPYRSDTEWAAFKGRTIATVKALFGTLPKGFFINGDPRGYALKIDPDKGTVPQGMHTDMGRYGILAAEINA